VGNSGARTFTVSVTGKMLRVLGVVALLGIAAFATTQLWIAQHEINDLEDKLAGLGRDMETLTAEAQEEASTSVSSLSDELDSNEAEVAKSIRRSARQLAATEETFRTCMIDVSNQLSTLEIDRWGGVWPNDSMSTQCSEFMYPVDGQGD
jgi:biopolymer transport protein ExbB/TolQ